MSVLHKALLWVVWLAVRWPGRHLLSVRENLRADRRISTILN